MNAINERIQPIRELMKKKGLDAFVVRRNPNLAWAIAGRAHVPSTIDAACFDLIVTLDSVIAVTNSIEAPRLVAEEFPAGLEVKIINWWEGRDSLLPRGDMVGSDQAGAGRIDLSLEVEVIRSSLIESDVARFKEICVDAASALGAAMKEVKSSDREIDVAGLISKSLWESDLEIAFLGVAGESRVKRFRHPLPTSELVGSRVVASICAKRKGLIASLTRIVTFGELSEPEINSYFSLLQVEAALFDATNVGSAFSEPVKAAVTAYPANGFDADEWTHHHQGGPTGYLPRDWPATTTTTRLIAEHQPIAWNPTGQGWKVEDTLLTTTSGVKILSIDPNWPMRMVQGRNRPNLLRK
ncbi:MAG: aminopeptidase P family N-terminal domain-containing protein [Candidatus Planktophila sp.]|nr:aminopeptidase P family N-terminal domain-containing protein [Candidatus Planktophila sp.]